MSFVEFLTFPSHAVLHAFCLNHTYSKYEVKFKYTSNQFLYIFLLFYFTLKF